MLADLVGKTQHILLIIFEHSDTVENFDYVNMTERACTLMASTNPAVSHADYSENTVEPPTKDTPY